MNAKKAGRTVTSLTTLSPHSETDRPTIDDPRGHPKEIFLTEGVIENRLLCCRCSLVLRNPFQANASNCGDSFCGYCMELLLRQGGGKFKCPRDQTTVKRDMCFRDTKANKEILSMKVCCTEKDHGCTKTFPLEDLENHRKVCDFAEVRCPDCTEVLRRNVLPNHKNNTCPKRTVPCKHCENEMKYEELKEHNNNCKYFPVPCDLCKNTIKRCEIDEHKKDTCPEKKVQCPFWEVGCRFERERRHLQAHIKEDANEHMKKTIDVVKDQRKLLEQVRTGTPKQIASEAEKCAEKRKNDKKELSQRLGAEAKKSADDIREIKRELEAKRKTGEQELQNKVQRLEAELEKANKQHKEEIEKLRQQQMKDFKIIIGLVCVAFALLLFLLKG